MDVLARNPMTANTPTAITIRRDPPDQPTVTKPIRVTAAIAAQTDIMTTARRCTELVGTPGAGGSSGGSTPSGTTLDDPSFSFS